MHEQEEKHFQRNLDMLSPGFQAGCLSKEVCYCVLTYFWLVGFDSHEGLATRDGNEPVHLSSYRFVKAAAEMLLLTFSSDQPLTRTSLLAFSTSSVNLPVTSKSTDLCSILLFGWEISQVGGTEKPPLLLGLEDQLRRKLVGWAGWVADWASRGRGREQQHLCFLFNKLGWTSSWPSLSATHHWPRNVSWLPFWFLRLHLEALQLAINICVIIWTEASFSFKRKPRFLGSRIQWLAWMFCSLTEVPQDWRMHMVLFITHICVLLQMEPQLVQSPSLIQGILPRLSGCGKSSCSISNLLCFPFLLLFPE